VGLSRVYIVVKTKEKIMIYSKAKKANGNILRYHGGDKSKRSCDGSIVDNKPEAQHEKHQSSERELFNLIGYVDE